MVVLSRLAQIRAAANLSIVIIIIFIIIMIIILFLFLFCQIMYKSNQIIIFKHLYFGLCRLSFQIFCYFDDDDFTLIAVLKVKNIISKRSLCHSRGLTLLTIKPIPAML